MLMRAFIHKTRGSLAGPAAFCLGLLYLFASTQLAYPIKEWFEAKAETPVQAEAFACSIHKCACQNALQCKVRCCCFPKGFSGASHHDGDGLESRLTACGGGADSQGYMPPLAPHMTPASTAPVLTALSGEIIPFLPPDHPSPAPEAPQKVPIALS
ncbi:MAG: hypothetical protein JWP91_4090 [Fibrobacteres bacterium]|nr:hypothetical protein [Fibrobacterota bacterium]